MSTEAESEEEEEEEEEEAEEEEIPGLSRGSPRWKNLLRGRGSKNNSSVPLLRDLEVTGRLMLRVPRRLYCSPIYDNVVVSPEMMWFCIQSRNFWDSLIRTVVFCSCKLNRNHNVMSFTKNSSAQILLTKHIAKKNRIENMCLRYLKDGFIHTTWKLGYMASTKVTQRKEDWRPRQTNKERESSVTYL